MTSLQLTPSLARRVKILAALMIARHGAEAEEIARHRAGLSARISEGDLAAKWLAVANYIAASEREI
jgi:hypothetical protein